MSAFTNLTEGMKRMMKDWGIFQAAARGGTSASQLYQAMKEIGTVAFYKEAGATWNNFQQIFGLARRNNVARQQFEAADSTAAFSRNWVGLTPHARTYTAREAAPGYYARVNVTTLQADGSVVNSWTTVQVPILPESTKGSIIAYVTTVLTMSIGTLTRTTTSPQGTLASVNEITLALW